MNRPIPMRSPLLVHRILAALAVTLLYGAAATTFARAQAPDDPAPRSGESRLRVQEPTPALPAPDADADADPGADAGAELKAVGDPAPEPESEIPDPARNSSGSEPESDRPSHTRDELRFDNGDQMFGAFLNFSRSDGILWNHPGVPKPVRFKPDHVTEIRIEPGTQIIPEFDHDAVVTLQNGDRLQGRLLGFDGNELELDTWFAGRLRIPRAHLRLIEPEPPEARILFSGPDGIEGWTLGKVTNPNMDADTWKYWNGAFYADKAASIARDVHLPDDMRMDMDLAWRGNFHLAIAIYTDYLQPVSLLNKEQEPKFGGFYSIQLNDYSANLLPVTQTDPLTFLGPVPVRFFNEQSRAQITILASKARRTIALIVDGVLIKRWDEKDRFVGEGTAIRLVHQGKGMIRLRNLKVSDWDGNYPRKQPVRFLETEDVIRFGAGSQATGRIESIQDLEARFTTVNSDQTVPLDQLEHIAFAENGSARSPRRPTDVTFHLVGENRLTLQLEHWSAEALSGRTVFGPAKIQVDAVTRARLQPEPPPESATP